MRKSIFIAIVSTLLFCAAFTVSCGKRSRSAGPSAEESFRRAMDKFERGKYLDASDELTLITLNYSGSSIIDSAQYFLGEAHFRMKEYYIAASEYQRLIDQFPSSPLVDDAKYKVGLSYYKLSPNYQLDQENTVKAIKEFQEFTEFFPESELVPSVLKTIMEARVKLAKKTYRNGVLYFKMRDFESAIVYFDDVLNNYYDTIYAPQAMFDKGKSYARMKKYDDAENTYRKLLEKYPNSPAAGQARHSLESLRADIEDM